MALALARGAIRPRFNRLPATPFVRRLLLCFLWLLPWSASADSPCAADRDPLLTLTVTAGAAVVVDDRQLIVQVHDDGCIALHRPAFHRDAGDYRLQLSAADWQTLRQQIDALRSFDATKARTDLVNKQGRYRKDGAAAIMEVVDADHFELTWRNGSKQARADWSGVHADAEQFPEIVALAQLSRTIANLQALALRSDAEKVAGAKP